MFIQLTPVWFVWNFWFQILLSSVFLTKQVLLVADCYRFHLTNGNWWVRSLRWHPIFTFAGLQFRHLHLVLKRWKVKTLSLKNMLKNHVWKIHHSSFLLIHILFNQTNVLIPRNVLWEERGRSCLILDGTYQDLFLSNWLPGLR